MTDLSDILPPEGHPDHELAKAELARLLTAKVAEAKAERAALAREFARREREQYVDDEEQRQAARRKQQKEHEEQLRSLQRNAPSPAVDEEMLKEWQRGIAANVTQHRLEAERLRTEARLAEVYAQSTKAGRLLRQAEELEQRAANNEPQYRTRPTICTPQDRRAYFVEHFEATPPGFYDELVAAALGRSLDRMDVSHRVVSVSAKTGEVTLLSGQKVAVVKPKAAPFESMGRHG